MKLTLKKKMIHSLIWAAAILLASWIIKDKKQATTMLFILIAGWAATGGLSAAKDECNWLKRRLFG